jgi:hypothetical protein
VIGTLGVLGFGGAYLPARSDRRAILTFGVAGLLRLGSRLSYSAAS